MPAKRYQISGQAQNTIPQFMGKALQQGGDGGYNKAERHYLGSIAEALKSALSKLPSDANLTLVGSFSQEGQALDITLEIHANHPRIGDGGLYEANDGTGQNETAGTTGVGSAPASGDSSIATRESTEGATSPENAGGIGEHLSSEK